jgi:FkbM family methyltransferase
MPIETIEDHTLHTRFLTNESLVIDLGANRGSFVKEMIERFHCRCIAVEPSPKMFQQIEPHHLLQKYNFAIASTSGLIDFHLSDIPVSSSLAYKPEDLSETITVSCKRLDEFILELGLSTIDVLKMDIEGVELEVLQSCPDNLLKSIGQITVEFHDHVGVVSKEDIETLIKRFKSLGFLHFSRYLGCHYDTLFINQELCPISTAEYLWFRHFLRNWEGIKRRIYRWKETILTRIKLF